MTEIYTYQLSDFGSGEFDAEILSAECQAALGAEPYQFARDTSQAELWFESAVNKSTLDGVVAAHQGLFQRPWERVFIDPVLEPVVPGASKVLANDRPAIEVQNGVTGFASLQVVWPLAQSASRQIRIRAKFILKASGTGSNIRIAAKIKSQAVGEDSSAAFAATGVVVVPVTFTTIGEVFEGELLLDASGFKLDDAVAIQVGRDGNEEIAGGAADDVDQAIQIIAVKGEAA